MISDDPALSYRYLTDRLGRAPERAQLLAVPIPQLRDVLALAADALRSQQQEVNMGLRGNKARGQVTPKDRAEAIKAGRIRRQQARKARPQS